MTKYRVFHRTFWKRNSSFPGGREPYLGPKHTITTVATEEAAQDVCRVWNKNHDPGPLSDKAEFEEV